MVAKLRKLPQAQKPNFDKEARSLRVSMLRELSGLKASIDRLYQEKAVVSAKRAADTRPTKRKKSKSA